MRRLLFIPLVAISIIVHAQEPPSASQVAQERRAAEAEVPKLAEVLELKPGMTVADVGAGGGAMTVVFGKWIGSGRVYATDIAQRQLGLIRDYVKREGLTNVTVLEGGASSTNLPDACCDAIFLQNVYHHIKEIEAFDKSVRASLKPGGRLAIVDFLPEKGSKVPDGVPANREGHGIPIKIVVDEFTAAGLSHVRTINGWPPDGKDHSAVFLALFMNR